MKDYLIESMTSYMYKMEKSIPQRKNLNESLKEELSFQDWLDKTFYPGFDPTDLSDEEYYELEDEYNSTKDLKEARNPENDEINAAIKRYLISDKAYIPKKDRDLFNKYGFTPEKYRYKGTSNKIVNGTNGDIVSDDFAANAHPDYDFANSLTKKKLDGMDCEMPTNDIRYYSRMFGYQPIGSNSKDTSKLSWNQFKSLQPYANEKQQIADAGGRIKREKEDLEKRIQAQKDASQRTIDYENKNKENAVKKAKARHNDRNKNESLSLKEMALPEMALQNAPNKNKTLSASDFKAAMGTVEANFDKFMKDKQYDAAIRFLWNNLKTDYNTHFKSMSSAGNDELVADLKKQYSALFSKATHWWNSLPQKKQEEKKKQELWRMLIDMNKMLSLNESLSLKEDYSKEDILSYIETLINIWSEVYEDVRVGDYDAIEYKIDDIESNEYAVMRFIKSFIK